MRLLRTFALFVTVAAPFAASAQQLSSAEPFKLGTFEIEGAPAVGIVRGVPYLFLKPSRGAVIGNGDSILLPYGRSQID